jgi:hypothetical protein
VSDTLSTEQASLELILRELAKQERDENKRMALRSAADMIRAALDALYVQRNEVALRDLNGVWAYAVRLINLIGSTEPTPPWSAAQDADKLSEYPLGKRRKAA